MNPNQNSKFSQRSKDVAVGTNRTQASQAATLEFASPEEMLRHDAAQAEVPDRIAQRLQESIRQEPPRPKSWWRRLFGAK